MDFVFDGASGRVVVVRPVQGRQVAGA